MNCWIVIAWIFVGFMLKGFIDSILSYFKYRKVQKQKKFNDALDRMQRTTFEFEGRHICFWQAIHDLSAEDAVKVFLLYEELRKNMYYEKYKNLNKTINSLTKNTKY